MAKQIKKNSTKKNQRNTMQDIKEKVIITVFQQGRFIKAFQNGVDVSNQIPRPIRQQAIEFKRNLVLEDGGFLYVADGTLVTAPATQEAEVMENATTPVDTVVDFIKTSAALKPTDLIMSDIKWKYLVRTALRGKNIMMAGASGSGKTVAAKVLGSVLNRPTFYFNLGATQDPRATLIGNTHFAKDSGTYFSQSLFVKAIQTENAVILLDELSRANPEAWNILMTVLDDGQRYLRLDEADGAPTIMVHPSVTFIATANIGNEYTATRVIDRALLDRFNIIEMDQLNKDQEMHLLKIKHPTVNDKLVEAIAEIAEFTRKEVQSAMPKISTTISTRVTVEIAGLLADGFTLAEAAEVLIYPFFSADGGAESERVYIKQVVQKYCANPDIDGSDPFAAKSVEVEFPF